MSSAYQTANTGAITFLPAELLLHVFSYLGPSLLERQSALHACCLVCRRWYVTAVPMLYEHPLNLERCFDRFAAAILSPRSPHAPKSELLGRYVRFLDMSQLVHHSSNSVTAKLLARTKDGLEVFIAPSLSVSTASFAALSKCTRMRALDLTNMMRAVDFYTIKRAVRRMPELASLEFPCHTIVTSSAADIPWPSALSYIAIGGEFLPHAMPAFSWPPALESLSFTSIAVARPQRQQQQQQQQQQQPPSYLPLSLALLLDHQPLPSRLQALELPDDCSALAGGIELDSLLEIAPNLTSAAVPGDSVTDVALLALMHVAPPRPLTTLDLWYHGRTLGSGWGADSGLGFTADRFVVALASGLWNVRRVNVCASKEVADERFRNAFDHLKEVMVRDNALLPPTKKPRRIRLFEF